MRVKTIIFDILHNKLNLELKSPIWTHPNIYSAFELAFNSGNPLTVERVFEICTNDNFLDIIKLIDGEKAFYLYDFSRDDIAAILVTTMRDGEVALRFWTTFRYVKSGEVISGSKTKPAVSQFIESKLKQQGTRIEKDTIFHSLISFYAHHAKDQLTLITNSRNRTIMDDFLNYPCGYDYLINKHLPIFAEV